MGTKIKCLKCNSIVEGDGKGNCVSCECGACFIDETPYYARISGDPKFIMQIDKDGNEFPMIDTSNTEKRPSKENYYLDIAEAVSERSTCLRKRYGAIIVNNDEIISTGYNGAPRGIVSCLDNNKCARYKSERGMDYAICKSVHAEQNAIISASRKDMIGATMYIVGIEVKDEEESTHYYVEDLSPCSICKRMIINAGITKVYVRTGIKDYKLFFPEEWKEIDIMGGY